MGTGTFTYTREEASVQCAPSLLLFVQGRSERGVRHRYRNAASAEAVGRPLLRLPRLLLTCGDTGAIPFIGRRACYALAAVVSSGSGVPSTRLPIGAKGSSK